MSFVYPGFLFALLAIGIPIVIHLFHFRRFRKVYFSNVSFLQQLSDESKKQSRLKHLLVLAARILAIVCLVLAFARPFIPIDDQLVSMQGNAISVYVDNSFSMNALSRQGSLLDDAKERAREIAAVYHSTDFFQLLTNDFEGRHQRFVTRDEFLSMLDEVDISPGVRSITGVMERQTGLLDETMMQSKRAYLISDFQKSIADFSKAKPDTGILSTFIPIPAEAAENVYIDSCWFESPVHIEGEAVGMMVRIRNETSRELSAQPLRLIIDGVQRSIASFDIGPNGYADVQVSWTHNRSGIQQGWVEIADYPVTFDDRLYFSYRVYEEIPVLVVEEGNHSPFLNTLFGNNALFSYAVMPSFSIHYSRFSEYNLIVLSGLNSITSGLAFELQQFLEQGGHLVIFPGSSAELASYAGFLQAVGSDYYTRMDTTGLRVNRLNERHPVYSGVFEHLPENPDFPTVTHYYVISKSVESTGQPLMWLQNDQAFFSSQAIGNGQLFLSSVPLLDAFGNFQRHALFVPTMVNIAIQSQSFQPLYHTVGHPHPIAITGNIATGDDVFFLRGKDKEVIPEHRRTGSRWQLFFHDQIQEAGSYMLYAAERPIQGLSFNYDRRESDLKAYTASELLDALKESGMEQIQLIDAGGHDFESALKAYRMGRQLWRHFLILTLVFLMMEMALLRLWR